MATAKAAYFIEAKKGKVRWYYRLKAAKNGQILLTSQGYFSKANALRAAQLSAYKLKVDMHVIEGNK